MVAKELVKQEKDSYTPGHSAKVRCWWNTPISVHWQPRIIKSHCLLAETRSWVATVHEWFPSSCCAVTDTKFCLSGPSQDRIKITFGFSRSGEYGMMLYHHNRLVQACVPVAIQKKASTQTNLQTNPRLLGIQVVMNPTSSCKWHLAAPLPWSVNIICLENSDNTILTGCCTWHTCYTWHPCCI